MVLLSLISESVTFSLNNPCCLSVNNRDCHSRQESCALIHSLYIPTASPAASSSLVPAIAFAGRAVAITVEHPAVTVGRSQRCGQDHQRGRTRRYGNLTPKPLQVKGDVSKPDSAFYMECVRGDAFKSVLSVLAGPFFTTAGRSLLKEVNSIITARPHWQGLKNPQVLRGDKVALTEKLV